MDQRNDNVRMIVAVLGIIIGICGTLLYMMNINYWSSENIAYSDIGDSDVYIHGRVIDVLNLAFASYDVEYKYCIGGYKQGDKYILKKITATNINFANASYMESTICPKDTLMMIHNHKGGLCELSDVDITSFEYIIENDFIDEPVLNAVQCGQNMIGIYRYKEYDHAVEWVTYG